MRIVSGRDAARVVERIATRGAEAKHLGPRVQKIVDSVRHGGDRELRR